MVKRRRALLAGLFAGICLVLAGTGSTAHGFAVGTPIDLRVDPTAPQLSLSQPPSTDPCTYPSPPPSVNCSAPITQPSITAPSEPVGQMACGEPDPAGGTSPSSTVTATLAENGIALQVLESPTSGFSVGEDQATDAALAFSPGAAVCSRFPAVLSDSQYQSLDVWMVGLQPAQSLVTHGGLGSASGQFSFLYAIVDAQTGNVLREVAGAPS